MSTRNWKRILKYTGGVFTVSLGFTLFSNEFDFNSIGIVRLGRVAFAAGRIANHYKKTLYSSTLDPDSQEYKILKSKAHHEAAEILLDLCCANKGVYIKVGQHLATLDYLVPPEYIKVMKVLHSNAPKSSLSSVYKVLRQDLKAEPSEIFEYFEEVPLGTASLAQVHRARLKKDGSLVAVKVQHSLVMDNSKADMRAMEVIVKIMSSLFEDFRFQWLIDETKLNLPKELDFLNEAKNAEKIQNILKDFKWLKIPKVNEEYSTSRVLIMEFAEGVQVTDLNYINDKKVDRITLSTKLGELYSHMIFKHGFVHSDPHPGNILIRKKENDNLEIVLLDHGLYASLSEEFRWNYSKFWMSILKRDVEGMKVNSEKLGIGTLYPILVCMVTGRTWNSVTGGIDKIRYTEAEKEEFVSTVPNLLTQIGEVLQSVNREILLILKTNDLLRGIEHSLNVHKRQPSFLVMSKCCLENIYDEKMRHSKSIIERFYIRFWKQWIILRLNVYYFYTSLKSKMVA
ncbi:conserved hypothetical protein [Pediculus humanus corporis]|uniref:Protein kinase domain-containing protein n=1 Tax=Pediculus humanus subsp. corporis TaxID=121224 RepID=E0VQ85_PEDHC|nr:uncharacterized protein Phum_PHUM373420 [Pediculus humanus corporis]EEB15541.1 conserved hypothetical protein [Pediculus humanus corporis]